MAPDKLLDGLNQAQIRAVTAPTGRVLVIAGAGSGKTRVLTRRIAWRIARGETDPNRVLALTFTRKAAIELRDRQRQLGLRDRVPAGTFHSFALSQLRQRWDERRTVPPTLINSKIRFVARICRPPAGVELTDVVAEIEWARARLIEPDDYGAEAHAAGRVPPAAPEFIAELMVDYQKEKRRKRVVDFDDLLELAIRDLRADPDYGAAVRWRHRHFYVDEFQDVNPLQHALLSEWLGDRDDLFIVGDPRQSIYAWNGADPDLMNSMIGADGITTVNLRDNYRSTPQVLGLADTVLEAAPGFTAPGGTPVEDSTLIGHRHDGPAPTLTRYDSDRAEAVGIAEAVRLANAGGYRYSQQAVLVRTNAQLAIIEQELSALRIPSRVRSGPGPLGSPEVKAVLGAIGRQGIDLVQQLEELDQQLAEEPRIAPDSDSGSGSGSDGEPVATVPAAGQLERHANLAALSRLIHDYLTTEPVPTGPGFLAWLTTVNGSDVEGDDEAVDLVTFHGAKGLEWPVVHVAGLEDGFVPIVYATTRAQLGEEMRLLYVALTRAEQSLNLSWSAKRTFGTKSVGRDPAPIVARLAAAITKVGGSSITPDWRSHIARSREAIDSGRGPADEPATPVGADEIYAALRRWRERKARAAQVPAHVIVSDRALRAVADHRPATMSRLATVTDLRPAKLTRFGPEILDIVGSA
ncbi:MAG: ATP-dependent DNA helicase UvrD2 [Acidimicrobiia bacterium]|nr:ATP-dependent DNA helicase UvrD2 [Acidimicrobiia bacterium]